MDDLDLIVLKTDEAVARLEPLILFEPGETSPPCAYSVGMGVFGLPDLILFGNLSTKKANDVLRDISSAWISSPIERPAPIEGLAELVEAGAAVAFLTDPPHYRYYQRVAHAALHYRHIRDLGPMLPVLVYSNDSARPNLTKPDEASKPRSNIRSLFQKRHR